MADLGNSSFNSTYVNFSNIGGAGGISPSHLLSLTLLYLAAIVTLFGIFGNIIVFQLLFFKFRRSQSTVYILNLTFADFTFLAGCSVIVLLFLCSLTGVPVSNEDAVIATDIGSLLYNFGFNASNSLLTAISLERCLAVLFPIWNRCHRPKHQSMIISVLMWALSFLVTGLECSICSDSSKYQAPGSERCTSVYFFTSALYLLMVLLMVVSCLVLVIEICKSSKQCQPPKLYIVIVVTVLVFLLSVVPARILGLLLYFKVLDSDNFVVNFFFITTICSTINSSANPYIYIFVGRWKMGRCKGSIKQTLENIFRGDTYILHQRETSISNTHVSET